MPKNIVAFQCQNSSVLSHDACVYQLFPRQLHFVLKITKTLICQVGNIMLIFSISTMLRPEGFFSTHPRSLVFSAVPLPATPNTFQKC